MSDDPRHNLRLPPALKAKLAHSAIDHDRSMNAEILSRLERSFATDPATQIVEMLEPIARLDDADQAKVIDLLVSVGTLIVKSRSKKR